MGFNSAFKGLEGHGSIRLCIGTSCIVFGLKRRVQREAVYLHTSHGQSRCSDKTPLRILYTHLVGLETANKSITMGTVNDFRLRYMELVI